MMRLIVLMGMTVVVTMMAMVTMGVRDDRGDDGGWWCW